MVLPDHIASQIAAGEVIERPASVVKELVENSIDAGSSAIEIAVDAGCLNIRVADNGYGMEADDALLAFHRHATSKLSSADDLWSLKTMGFRGEALPSIASVSHLTCFTRTSAAQTGVKIECANGTISSTKTGCAAGTVIEVGNLFSNVPARLQFLKRGSTEFGHVQEAVQALAIAHPQISFELLKSGQQVFKTSGSESFATAIVESGFLRSLDDLLQVNNAGPEQIDPKQIVTKQIVGVHGYVAKPTTFRGDRKGILVIVNGRPVRCFVSQKALDYAFSDLIPRGRFPVAVLNITLDTSRVDVNVHPSKKEIKYLAGNDVYAAVQQALTRTVRGSSMLLTQLKEQLEGHASSNKAMSQTSEQLSFKSSLPYDTFAYKPGYKPRSSISAGTTLPGYESSKGAVTALPDFGPSASGVAAPLEYASGACSLDMPQVAESTAPYAFPAQWRLIGYLHNAYFLIESPAGLEIIEQHIAHERVLYERLLAIADNQQQPVTHSQRLITSVDLQLSPIQLQSLQENIELFRRLGFDFEIDLESDMSSKDGTKTETTNTETTCKCTEVPVAFASADYGVAIQQIMDKLDQTGNVANTPAEMEILKSIACQSAIKNGMPLSQEEILNLISQWCATPRNDTCPHGRPIKLSFSMEQLFSEFHP